MKVKVINASSKRTRDKIKKSFAILMKEKKSLSKITVTDLVNKAEITRSAFYTHYENIYDVARELHEEMLDVLVSNTDNLKNIANADKYFDEIFAYLKENEEMYTLILSSDYPLFFTNQLQKIIKNILNSFNSLNYKYMELNIVFFIDGAINLVIRHFRGEINYSLDEINNYVKKTFKKLFID